VLFRDDGNHRSTAPGRQYNCLVHLNQTDRLRRTVIVAGHSSHPDLVAHDSHGRRIVLLRATAWSTRVTGTGQQADPAPTPADQEAARPHRGSAPDKNVLSFPIYRKTVLCFKLVIKKNSDCIPVILMMRSLKYDHTQIYFGNFLCGTFFPKIE